MGAFFYRCAVPLISALVLASCASIQDASLGQRALASGAPHSAKGTIPVYRAEPYSVSLSPRHFSLILGRSW